MKSGILFASAMVLALGMGVSQAAGDAAAGQTKAAACVACHGVDGNSNGPRMAKSCRPAYVLSR